MEGDGANEHVAFRFQAHLEGPGKFFTFQVAGFTRVGLEES